MTAADLVGAWRLVEWTNEDAGGRRTHPMGPDAEGWILYTPDGHMSVTIQRPGRPRFTAGDLLRATAEERAAAAATFVAYCGRYRVEGDTVTHDLTASLFPNWTGTAQVRRGELQGRRLTLSAGPLLLEGRPQTARLVWERVRR